MSAPEHRVRLRQAVVIAADLEPVAERLRAALGLGEPFNDPGVGLFGLRNAVFAVGDTFLEVVCPEDPSSAGARYLERRGGDCGYMVMFDLEDLEPARERAQHAGVRAVWGIDLPDISGTHLHPSDMGGAIVSIDGSRPYGSWRWGGPRWAGMIGRGASGTLSSVTVAVADPPATAALWARVLGCDVEADPSPSLRLDGGEVRFVAATPAGAAGLVEIGLQGCALRGEVTIAGVLLRGAAEPRA